MAIEKFKEIIEKTPNILSSPPGDTGGPNFVLDENGLFTLRALKDKEMSRGEYLYSASDANQFMNRGRAENKNFRTNMYQAYDNLGPGYEYENSFTKNYEKILNDSTLNKKQNRYTLSDRVNIFYTLYNILLGDKFLENKHIGIERYDTYSIFKKLERFLAGSYFKNVNFEWGSFKEHTPRVFLDIFSGTHKIISIEDYIRGFKKMSEIALKYGDISNSNPREIWVYNNSKENWEKADLSKLIELAVLKDKELETRIEEEAKKKAEEEAKKKAEEERVAGLTDEEKAAEEAKKKAAADLVELELEAANPMGDFSFAVIDTAPIYPGCESEVNNAAKKRCMSSKIQKFVQKKFNTDLASDLGLEGIQQIFVNFKIDKTGNITNVQARAPHPKLKQEAIKAIMALPKMTPGKQGGRTAGVLYSLTFRFRTR